MEAKPNVMRIKAAIEVVGNTSGRVWHANGKQNGAETLVATTDRWSLVSGRWCQVGQLGAWVVQEMPRRNNKTVVDNTLQLRNICGMFFSKLK